MMNTPTPKPRAGLQRAPRAPRDPGDILRLYQQPRFSPEELARIENHERAVGIEHVTVLDRGERIAAALAVRGYGVQARPEPGPRDGEVVWHATASVWRPCCKGGSQHPHVIARSTGASREQALRALAGELGVEL